MPRTNLSRLVDVAGLDAHLAPERVDDTGAVGADEARLALALERVDDLVFGVSTETPANVSSLLRTRISSAWGMPSVMQTMRPISFSMASIMASAALGGGTYSTVASGCVSRTA